MFLECGHRCLNDVVAGLTGAMATCAAGVNIATQSQSAVRRQPDRQGHRHCSNGCTVRATHAMTSGGRMSTHAGNGCSRRIVARVAAIAAVVVVAVPVLVVSAASVAVQIAVDPFTQSTCHGSGATNHHANVEPDSFSNGSTMVAAYQVGRIFDGGACAIGFSTSTDNGATWTSGLLPALTKYTSPAGAFDRATDAAVGLSAYT